jgi:predicted Zn-dependent protease
MKTLFKNLLALALLVVVGFIFHTQLSQIKSQIERKFFPCTQINYSIGTFDTRFGISKTDFLKALSDAEAIWEKPISKELFSYQPEGDLKINLEYDERQESTQKLKQMGVVLDNTRANYDSIKAKYDTLSSQYKTKKATLDVIATNFETRRAQYEADVAAANKRGGADKATYTRLNTEKEYLNSQVAQINALQDELNSLADNINALAVTLNQLARTLNINVKAYNTIGSSLGGEFEEGTYTTGPDGERIDIYQFDNKAKLVRVLAHELGHALGLEHNDDPKAIMYRLNNGVNEKLTDTDLVALKKLCRIQ